jgi:ABC-type phosphate/phosphonate transport system substrate-binding protein
MPGTSGATEEIQIRASMSKFSDYLKKSTGKDVNITVADSFAPGEDGKPKFDMIIGPTYNLGVAARDQKYSVIGKFRDVMALFIARFDAPIDRLDDVKGQRLGLHVRSGMTGPMAAKVLDSSGLPLATFPQFTEFNTSHEDDIAEALVQNKVDVVALSPGGWEEAEKRFPDKLKLVTTSDPMPGYAIALRSDLNQDESLKIAQALYRIDDTDEGKAALKAITLGSAAGSLDIKQATSREYVRAAEAIEAARKLFPPKK